MEVSVRENQLTTLKVCSTRWSPLYLQSRHISYKILFNFITDYHNNIVKLQVAFTYLTGACKAASVLEWRVKKQFMCAFVCSRSSLTDRKQMQIQQFADRADSWLAGVHHIFAEITRLRILYFMTIIICKPPSLTSLLSNDNPATILNSKILTCKNPRV